MNNEHCHACGTPFDCAETHYGLDVLIRDDVCFVIVIPCCDVMAGEVDAFGYAAGYGRRIEDVASELLGASVVGIDEDGRVTLG